MKINEAIKNLVLQMAVPGLVFIATWGLVFAPYFLGRYISGLVTGLVFSGVHVSGLDGLIVVLVWGLAAVFVSFPLSKKAVVTALQASVFKSGVIKLLHISFGNVLVVFFFIWNVIAFSNQKSLFSGLVYIVTSVALTLVNGLILNGSLNNNGTKIETSRGALKV